MPEMNFAEAVVDGLSIALDAHADFSVIGRGISGHGPEGVADKALSRFGGRIFDPPTSEAAVALWGLGAAVAGQRMFVHFGTSVFAFEAWNQVVNEAANVRYMSGGRLRSPVTYYMFHGLRNGGGPQHSASSHAAYAHNPGLEIVMPSNPADAKGLILKAIRSDSATIVLAHPALLSIRGEVKAGDYEVPFGKAAIPRPGKDVTIVALSRQVPEALKAAQTLAAEGIDAEVLDPRTLVPLDEEAILMSVRKTGRLVIADEGPIGFGAASEIAGMVAEKGFGFLKAPVARVARPHTPVPFSPGLEAFLVPGAERIAEAVRKIVSN